jgi:ribosome-binding factor A
MKKRILQVADIIREKVSEIIARDVELPQGSIISVTKVQISPDVREAKVFLSIFPEQKRKEVFQIFISERRNLQKALGQELHFINTPKILFEIDQTLGKTFEIDSLIDQAQSDESRGD